ncbi:MAG: glycosyltransferase family 4 protein [Bacteroidales bacterium]|nr:glycosyltransferase family 4 protein [Bacteroidales bacterium]
MKDKNVAIIVTSITSLGPVKVMQTLVNYLSKIDHPLKIKVYYIKSTFDFNMEMNVPIERLNYNTFPFGSFDIIHTNGFRPDFFAFVNRKKIKYHISTLHNLVFEDLSFTYNRFISFIFGNIWLILWRKADKLICVSRSMKTYYEKLLPASKLEIIYNSVPENNDLVRLDSVIVKIIDDFRIRGLKIFGFSGILNKRKGLDQILNLLSIEKGLALVVFGSGEGLKKLQNIAEKLNVSDRVCFCGFMNNPVIYYRFLDFFVMPSRSEGFGLALVEAVQSKVPVICSDLEVFKELFNNDEVTFFKLENLSSLIDALREVNEDGPEKVDLAFTRYLKNYTEKLMATKYLELYRYAS